MNTVRLVIVVLVTYALGLGTGVVGGVALSYKELSKPVAAAAPPTVPAAPPSSVTLAPATPVNTPGVVAVVPATTPSSAIAPPAAPSQTPALSIFSTPATPVESSSAEVPTGSAAEATDAPPVDTPADTPGDAPSETATTDANSKSALLWIDSNKGPGFVTFIDGQEAGKTPMKISLVPGKHAVVVKGGDKFTTSQLKITVLSGQTKRVVVSLHSKADATPTPAAAAPDAGVVHTYHAPTYSQGSSSGGPPSVQGNRRF